MWQPPYDVNNELVQTEHYRLSKSYAYSLTTLLTWLPLRHELNHAESFLIQVWVNTTNYNRVND